ncbi:hypothetical protein J2045_003383 [Peteryoungia aggregata LMG 23059]|uniref:Uncharacterized protein n=1 Tax=Peteryoungia aggregata LMG 23059 TaxID=1368425 RepID=A0ABU0GCG9_9HYPH|nr:hypothetical protein [Peteryoungia aggregata]MDQ0422335.1 hypothetical protein [Peteryoungia aggregata LMG 23059]
MQRRDRLEGLIFCSLDKYDPDDRVLWINMMIRERAGIQMFIRYGADTRLLMPRRSHAGRNIKPYFTNKRFIDAVIAKIPDRIIAELIAHSISLSTRES